MEDDDYIKYRGKCREMSEALCQDDDSLTLVRGHYYCPVWGKQPHWWCKTSDGQIIDPTARQFPSKGAGEYVEFDGMLECEHCGASIAEDDAIMADHHVYCSGACYMRDVM